MDRYSRTCKQHQTRNIHQTTRPHQDHNEEHQQPEEHPEPQLILRRQQANVGRLQMLEDLAVMVAVVDQQEVGAQQAVHPVHQNQTLHREEAILTRQHYALS